MRRDLDLGDDVAKIGEFDQDVRRIGARSINCAQQVERLAISPFIVHSNRSTISPLSERPSISRTASAVDALRAAIGDALVEQRQRVAHRAFGDAGDEGQRVGLGRYALGGRDPGEMLDHQRRVDPLADRTGCSASAP